MIRQAVILAGGKGTRLQERLKGLPKPLIDIAGVPLLERQILLCKRYGITRALILVNHAADQVIEFCRIRDNWGMDIELIDDGEPRGTAGAVLAVRELLDEEFLVLYGDTMLDVDLHRFYRFHQQNGGAATLFLHPNDHPQDSDLVEMGEDNRITAFHPYKGRPSGYYANLVNAALYIVRRSAIEEWKQGGMEDPKEGGGDSFAYHSRPNLPPPRGRSVSPQAGTEDGNSRWEGEPGGRGRKIKSAHPPLDFGRDLFPEMLRRGEKLIGYNSPEYIKDCGTPERVDTVSAAVASGKVERSNLEHAQMAVFVDRDGTINRKAGFLTKAEEFDLIDGVAEAIAKLNRSDYRTVVITNQPVLARGECTPEELARIHARMDTLLAEKGAYVDRLYFCPHHPDSGFEGEVKELKIKCDCRKPQIGLILQAQNDLNVDLERSWMVGDTTADLLTAKNAGLRSILVETGDAGKDGKYDVQPDCVMADLPAAVELILKNGRTV